MALRYYERKDSQGKIFKWDDAEVLTKAELISENAQDQAKLDLDTDAFNEMFKELDSSTFDFVDEYRTYLQNTIDERKTFIDYYDFDKVDVTLSVADSKWYTPESVVSVCGEEVGNEGVNMIDEVNTTYWEHTDNEPHRIILKLKDYAHRWDAIQFRRFSNVRSALTNLDVYIAYSDNPNNLFDPSRLAVSGLNLTTDVGWNTFTFTNKLNGMYLGLDGFGSQHASNIVRIREVQVRAITKSVDF